MFNPIGLAISTAVKTASSVAKATSTSTSTSTSKSSSNNKISDSYNPMNDSDYDDYRNDLMRKYRKEVAGISNYNDVDLGVAFEMLYTNSRFNTNYKGGGVKEQAEWDSMVKDFNKLTSMAHDEIAKDPRKQQILKETKDFTESGKYSTNTSTTLGNAGGFNAGGGGLPMVSTGIMEMEKDTVGVIIGIGVLYMFLSMFRG